MKNKDEIISSSCFPWSFHSIEVLLAKNPNLLDQEEENGRHADGETEGKKEKKKKKWSLRRSKTKDKKSTK